MGANVDFTALIASMSDFYVADRSNVDTSVLTVEEWARRKNASFRGAQGITHVVIAGATLLSSIPYGVEKQSFIERIGIYTAESPQKFWTWWALKSMAAGFIFSRYLPWAEWGTNPKRQLRFANTL